VDDSIQTILGVLLGVVVLGLWAWSILWAYGDAERRGKSGCLVALLVLLLSWPVGLIAWLVFRPEERSDGRA
jgi:hypothetical protein